MKILKNQKIWVCWKYVSVDGHRTKKPYDVTGIPTGTSQDHADEWSEYSTARKALADAKPGFDGIGFIMPEGVFLLDIDHKDISDPLVQELLALFPTYMEISPSGHGYHIYGRADLSRIPKVWSEKEKRWKLDDRYYAKNSNSGLELYVGGLTNRFATFTGNTEGRPDQISDCTEAVLTFLDSYMKKLEEHVSCGRLDTDRFIKFSEDQIPEIVDSLYSQRNGEKFKALYHDGDISAYGSPSEADAALCALIAFRTGPDPEIIDAIFRESALYRDKWDRADYSSSTINAGIKACHGVFHKSVKVTPPFVLIEKNKEYVHPTLLADYVRKHLNYLFVREAQRGSYQKYVYRDGVYQIYSDDMFKGAIKAFVIDYDPMLLKMGTIDEAFRQLSTDLTYIPQTALNADENLINFQNGLLDIRTMNLRPHDPAVLCTIQSPCDWTGVPSPAPVFDSYLSTLTGGNDQTQALLMDFVGAALSNVPGHRMKKALFLHGPGDTGKSQLKRLVEKLLGFGNYTGIDMAQMEARFGTSSIYGKRLAGSSDMSFMTVSELKVFKRATGGDTLFAEFKGQDSFEFVYSGLLWFCMNELPKFGGDDGTWVFDRIIPVHCPNVIPLESRDSKLLDKMYSERAGIVYGAITAFRSVIERGYHFTETQEMMEARKDYRIENNTALEFFQTCMKPRRHLPKNNDPFTVKKVYTAYCRWYDQNYGKQYRKTKKEFFRAIADSLGTTYEEMVMQNAKGTILRDYGPDADAWEEYGLSDEIFGEVRKWAA